MIRLYLDQKFEVGKRYRLPPNELRYLKSVRRGQGSVELFNRLAQVAEGEVEGEVFRVDNIRLNSNPIHPLTLLVGLPENAVVRKLISSLSELGIEKLIFFPAERSQSGMQRLKKMRSDPARWLDLAIESMRQCERPHPLDVEFILSKDGVRWEEFAAKTLMDEDPERQNAPLPLSQKKEILVVGPEGGWTESERNWFLEKGLKILHLPTAILRVQTACIAGAAWRLKTPSS